jgi:hypothetical protein
MPLQLWVQAARLGLRIKEVGVPRIYLDPNRAFGGVMDDPESRLTYYRDVIAAAEHDDLYSWQPGSAMLASDIHVRGGCPEFASPQKR